MTRAQAAGAPIVPYADARRPVPRKLEYTSTPGLSSLNAAGSPLVMQLERERAASARHTMTGALQVM